MQTLGKGLGRKGWKCQSTWNNCLRDSHKEEINLKVKKAHEM